MIPTFYPTLGETVYRQTLPNGLTVAVVPKPGFQRKCAYLVTHFGSIHQKFTWNGRRCETPAGVAHYLEHKLFDLPGRDVTSEFAALGANPNAFTSYDMTAYHFTCTEHFSENLRLLLEFVFTPYFTDESVAKERGIIEQEILMYADNPDAQVFDDLMLGMHRHHPIRDSIAGTVESIGRITAQTLYDCYHAFYHPANMMLCVVGDVEPEAVAALAAEFAPGAPQPLAVPDLGQPEDGACPIPEQRRNMDVAMTNFQLGFHCSTDAAGADYARWELVAELAAELLFGEGSQLYLWMYQDGLIDSSFGGGLETVDGAAMIVCGGDSEDPWEIRRCILNQAAYLGEHGIDERKFEGLKRSFYGRRVQGLDSFEATCFRLCAYEFLGYDYMTFPGLFDSVTPKDVQTFLAEHILENRSALAIVHPLPNL